MSELTREEILKMEPGRKLDMLINLHVMKYIPVSELNWWLKPESFNCDPSKAKKWVQEFPYGVEFQGKEYAAPVRQERYGSDISTAWEVMKKMNECHFVKVERLSNDVFKGGWLCEIGEHSAFGETAPLAICRCVLLAVMGI